MSKMRTSGLFLKKPIPVYAEQWYPGEDHKSIIEIRHTTFGIIGELDTLEGKMTVIPGSYIITGPGGEKWAIREDVFLETYEEYTE